MIPQPEGSTFKLSILAAGLLETPLGSKRHTAAKDETTGYERAFRRAFNSQPRGRSG
jgi:hypothetical protein